MAGTKPHYKSLDSWRGVCAVLVAATHFFALSPIAFVPLIRHAGLFVDFFFVLSGFVIASNYQTAITTPTQLRTFMILRLGRLYPLHLFMLALVVAFECMILVTGTTLGTTGRAPFTVEHSVASIFLNLVFINGIGPHSAPTWNQAAWSASVEFYTYIVFALTVLYLRRFWLVGVIAIHLASQMILYIGNDSSLNLALLRGLSGFMTGVICYNISLWLRARTAPSLSSRFTIWELLSAGIMLGYVWITPQSDIGSMLSFYVFALVVLIYSYDAGQISRLLATKAFTRLGLLSYSIYMTHGFVQARLFNMGGLLGKLTGTPWIIQRELDGQMLPFLGTSQTQGTLLFMLMFTGVYLFSEVTFRFIETPTRLYARKLAHSPRLDEQPAAT